MIKNIFALLKQTGFIIKEYFKNYYSLLKNDNRVILLGVPTHGNMGDQAIVLAEQYILSSLCPNKRVIKITYDVLKIVEKLSLPSIPVKDTDQLFFHGGGNLGTLYPNEEKLRRILIERYSKNNIVIMPISIFFHENGNGKKELNNSINIYRKNNKIKIITRDETSYYFAKQNFKNKVLLLPDAVVALEDVLVNDIHREGITLLFRNDIEKIIDDKSIDIIRERILEKNIPLIVTDTIEAKRVYSDAKREKEVLEKINLINKSKLVITDRFHGMVFAVITHTPVIAFKSYDSKISSGVKWLENLGNVHLVESEDIESVFKLIDIYIDHYLPKKENNNTKEILMSNIKRLIEEKEDIL